MRYLVLAVALSLTACGTSGAINNGWKATKTYDPITGDRRCVVARYDNTGYSLYTRSMALYPVVENHPKHGLLVGVSSGGRYRVPVGNIQWRVDDLAFRTLLAAETPVDEGSSSFLVGTAAYEYPGISDEQRAFLKTQIETATRATAGIFSPTTMASGDTAKAMLDEMLSGTSLLYRAASAETSVGLPSGKLYRVGEVTSKGLRPIPLDQSFRDALSECDIS